MRQNSSGRPATAWLGGLVWALAASAQPVILHGPVVDAVTYSTARITWITDVSATRAIHYGLTGSYGATTSSTEKHTVHSWYLSGLAPNTTYHFRVCSTADAAERCSGDYTLTTARAPASLPAPPEPPRRYVDTAMPAGSYGEPFQVAPDCSNLPALLGTIAQLEDDLNYEIRIPARTVCSGQFVFPNRPKHRGWIVVKSTEADRLPPDTRITAEAQPALAVFRTDALPGTRLALTNIGTSCSPGALAWGITTPGMALFVCQPQGSSGGAKSIANVSWAGADPVVVTVGAHGYRTGNVVRIAGTGVRAVDGLSWRITVIDEHNFALDGSRGAGAYAGGGTATRNDAWTQAPHTAGAELPSSCAPNEWFFKTDVEPATQAVYWCTAPGQWTNVRAIVTADARLYAAIQFAAGASRYRFIGLEVTHIPTPDPPPPGWERPDYRQGAFGALVAILPTNDSIIFDRCDLHGLDYPSRLGYGFYLDGSNVALIHSRVHKVNRWTEKADGVNLEGCAINIASGPGPGRIENNFLEATGITVFFPDTSLLAAPQADYVIHRNYFSHPDKYLYGSPFNTSGKNYMNRHHLEWKAGQRVAVEGNIFDGNWMDVNQGAMVAVSPRVTSAWPARAITRIRGGVITLSGTGAAYAPGILVFLRNTGAAQHDGIWEVEEVLGPNEFKIKNAPGGSGESGTAMGVSSNLQISDIDIRNNVFRYGPNLVWILGHHDASSAGSYLTTKPTQRVRFANNLVYGMDARPAAQGGRASPVGANRSGRSGIPAFVALGMEDLIFRSNTIYDFRGLAPTFLSHDSITRGANAGLEVRDNLFIADPANIALISGLYPGVEALNLQWTQHPQPAWVFANNVICCQLSAAQAARKPPRNFYPDSAESIGFEDPGAGDFRLNGSSPFRADAQCFGTPGDCTSSGLDMGVSFEQLLSALADPLPGVMAARRPAPGTFRARRSAGRPEGMPQAALPRLRP
jgi:hypothetical protein